MFLMNSIDFMLVGFYIMWWFSFLTVLPLTKMVLLSAVTLDRNFRLALYVLELFFFFILPSITVTLQADRKTESCCRPVVMDIVLDSKGGEKHTDPK